MAPRKRCPVCGSRQWRKEPSSGLITCEEGHVLQNYRNETREVTELGPHAVRKRTLKSGRKKKERQSKANPKLYHGERARYHYFQCLQLLLRMQVVALTKAWDLPPEFEIMCRDIWSLHLSLLPNPPSPEPYLYASEQHAPTNEQPDAAEIPDEEDDEETLLASETTLHGLDKDPENSDMVSSSSSSEGEGETEDDPELEKLLRENSETPSSSEDEEQPRPQLPPDTKKRKAREVHRGYDAPAGNISVLMVACWTLRLPVMYMDFVRLIESYDLPYLDPLRLLPESLTAHLTKHTIQALSPHFAPTPMHLHRLTSRLARLMYQTFSVYTPECNAAPLLWRALISRPVKLTYRATPIAFSATLYMLTKKLCGILSLPLTLHYSLAPKLKRIRQQDPEHHKYDNAPAEVSLVAAVVVVLKLVYGLDGKKRVPRSTNDPACALPNFMEYMEAIRSSNHREGPAREDFLCADSTVSALDMDNEMIDEYMDFCEKALLPAELKEGAGL
ncbi:hypothetical protein NM688_g7884 [Phlebia brevispora]|uniref:Uncharacterized protein n=1 Tax=Phlebia brevispora TaxID=194682 RepID=A0ACC1RZY7_9APHY|nr:hypothetical protein NM688_g7884 [Phlebia brevispora]